MYRNAGPDDPSRSRAAQLAGIDRLLGAGFKGRPFLMALMNVLGGDVWRWGDSIRRSGI